MDDIHSFDDLTPDRVVAVQVGTISECDAPLALIRVGPPVGHIDHTGSPVGQSGNDFVGKLVPRPFVLAVPGDPALDDVTRDDPMPFRPVEIGRARRKGRIVDGPFGQTDEISRRHRGFLVVDPEDEHPLVGGHFGIETLGILRSRAGGDEQHQAQRKDCKFLVVTHEVLPDMISHRN